MTSVGIMASAVDIPTVYAGPVLETSNTTFGTSLGAGPTVNQPAGVVAGNLLVAFVVVDAPGAAAITKTATWTDVFQIAEASQIIRLACFARIATGSDTLVISGPLQDYCCSIHRISNHAVTSIATDIKWATAEGVTGNGDPPNLTAGPTDDYLWLTVEGLDLTTGNTITAVPANYTERTRFVSASSASSVGLAVASRPLIAAAENPGTFTNNPTTRVWLTATVAIP